MFVSARVVVVVTVLFMECSSLHVHTPHHTPTIMSVTSTSLLSHHSSVLICALTSPILSLYLLPTPLHWNTWCYPSHFHNSLFNSFTSFTQFSLPDYTTVVYSTLSPISYNFTHPSPLTLTHPSLIHHSSPLTPHPSPLTLHSSPLTPHPSPLTPHSSPLTTLPCSSSHHTPLSPLSSPSAISSSFPP